MKNLQILIYIYAMQQYTKQFIKSIVGFILATYLKTVEVPIERTHSFQMNVLLYRFFYNKSLFNI